VISPGDEWSEAISPACRKAAILSLQQTRLILPSGNRHGSGMAPAKPRRIAPEGRIDTFSHRSMNAMPAQPN